MGKTKLETPSHRAHNVRKTFKLDALPEWEIVDSFEDEEEAKLMEQYYISLYRSWGFDLLNTKLGDEWIGKRPFTMSEEGKKNFFRGTKGINTAPKSEAHKKKLSEAAFKRWAK